MLNHDLYFALSVVVLAVALTFPVARLVWTLSVRRLQRRLARALEAPEIAAQRRRAYLIAVPLCAAFSWIFNLRLLAALHDG